MVLFHPSPFLVSLRVSTLTPFASLLSPPPPLGFFFFSPPLCRFFVPLSPVCSSDFYHVPSSCCAFTTSHCLGRFDVYCRSPIHGDEEKQDPATQSSRQTWAPPSGASDQKRGPRNGSTKTYQFRSTRKRYATCRYNFVLTGIRYRKRPRNKDRF